MEWSYEKKYFFKKSGTTKLCWADRVKFEFWRHFVGQKDKNVKIGKKSLNRFWQRYWPQRAGIIFHRILFHPYLNFCFYKCLSAALRSENSKYRSPPKKQEQQQEQLHDLGFAADKKGSKLGPSAEDASKSLQGKTPQCFVWRVIQ